MLALGPIVIARLCYHAVMAAQWNERPPTPQVRTAVPLALPLMASAALFVLPRPADARWGFLGGAGRAGSWRSNLTRAPLPLGFPAVTARCGQCGILRLGNPQAR
jgi:hypothetical protein